MTHLSPEQFVDLVDGVETESRVAHLQACTDCRQVLAELRDAARLTGVADVPEPSPLFWEHLSARVRAVTAAEPDRRPPVWAVPFWSWRLGAVAAAALVAVAAALSVNGPGTSRSDGAAVSASIDGSGSGSLEIAGAFEDPALQLVAELAAEVDWEAAAEAGLGTPAHAVDRIVPELNEAERLELRRLLQQQLANSGA